MDQELETVQTNNTSHSYIQATAKKDGNDTETWAHPDIGLIDLHLWNCTLFSVVLVNPINL